MRSRGRGGDGRIDPEKLKVVVRRLDEQLATAREQTRQLEDRDRQYDELRGVLEGLPEKLAHPVMVPYGPLAFFEGHLEHTNEVLVQLGSEYFAMKTSKHAIGTVDRRKQKLRRDMKDVDREVEELEAKKRLVVGEADACGVKLPGRRDDTDGILDIREPITEDIGRARESGVAGATVTRDADGYLDIREPMEECGVPGASVTRDADGYFDIREPLEESRRTVEDSVFAAEDSASSHLRPNYERLRELQRLEELEEQEDKDELGELDDLVESYERTGMPPSRPGDHDDRAAVPGGMESDAVSRCSAGAEIRSPADLYRLMSAADESLTTAPASAASSRPSAQENQFAPPARQPAEKAFCGGVRDTIVESPVAVLAAAPMDGGTAAAAAAAAPQRVSKFKADRAKTGR